MLYVKLDLSNGSNNFAIDCCALTSRPTDTSTAKTFNLIKSRAGLLENLGFECIFGVIIHKTDCVYGENNYNEICIENENSEYKCEYGVPARQHQFQDHTQQRLILMFQVLNCLKILFWNMYLVVLIMK